MKRLCALMAAAALMLTADPVWADNEDGRNRKDGDCREVDEGASCEDNDLSPSFQDSPVDRSFNPVICVLPDSCRFENPPSEQGEAT